MTADGRSEGPSNYLPFSISSCHHPFIPHSRGTSTHPTSLFLPGQQHRCQHQCTFFIPPSLCSLLINGDFAWLSFKRPFEKTARLGCESLNLSSELQVFKSQGIMRLPNGEDKIQQCTNYAKGKNGSYVMRVHG